MLGPFDHVGWVPDAPEPQGHKIGRGAAWDSSKSDFFVSEVGFWVYAASAKPCFEIPQLLDFLDPPTDEVSSLLAREGGEAAAGNGWIQS